MFIKIVEYESVCEEGVSDSVGSLGRTIRPAHVTLISGVDEVGHEKIVFTSREDLDEKMLRFWGPSYRMVGAQTAPPVTKGEAVLMRLTRNGKTEAIVAVGGAIFFMNDDGKTIDKEVCRR